MLFKNTYDPIIFHDVSAWARVTFVEKEIEELKKFKLAKDFFFFHLFFNHKHRKHQYKTIEYNRFLLLACGPIPSFKCCPLREKVWAPLHYMLHKNASFSSK